MDSKQIQTPSIKNDLEFVDQATKILTKLTEQVDKCCPHCKQVFKEIFD